MKGNCNSMQLNSVNVIKSMQFNSRYSSGKKTLDIILFIHASNDRLHYENLPMKYTEIFSPVNLKKFNRKCLIFFLLLLKT